MSPKWLPNDSFIYLLFCLFRNALFDSHLEERCYLNIRVTQPWDHKMTSWVLVVTWQLQNKDSPTTKRQAVTWIHIMVPCSWNFKWLLKSGCFRKTLTRWGSKGVSRHLLPPRFFNFLKAPAGCIESERKEKEQISFVTATTERLSSFH